MAEKLSTDRLLLNPLDINDIDFIYELVNLPDWIRFIGNRNVNSKDDAKAYIKKIVGSASTQYWVVRLKGEQKALGIVTFIKRDYLEHHDIGFGFLPQSRNKGYAYEATTAVLAHVRKEASHTLILATAIKENISSIRLLEKLGFQFEKEILIQDKHLQLFSTAADLKFG
ncbi:GNAT family N-acetyltransferase [Pontibacter silvestris]|uniref:GNAT family N-acetyltransferase n=1 Tax=Pontibacter silvestris TaxID=2305183 RepID=A0ABW4X1G9_9BACT|nr:GNAT family N-acetyltransferase [Pontibacter silvestris]MCC9136036.1 GNAT family N-acetyltransferase [Pontibacter silvestris]